MVTLVCWVIGIFGIFVCGKPYIDQFYPVFRFLAYMLGIGWPLSIIGDPLCKYLYKRMQSRAIAEDIRHAMNMDFRRMPQASAYQIPFKSIMWIGIVIIVFIALFGNVNTGSVKTALTNAESTINANAEAARRKEAEAQAKDPWAGTTRSREYQENWERASREMEAMYAQNTYPQFVWDIIDGGRF